MPTPLQQFSHYPNLPAPAGQPLTTLPAQPCPYLPDRSSTIRAFGAGTIADSTYLQYMNAGFRRSGRMIYQPICVGCRSCVQIRVPVQSFTPGKSQRRVSRQNADLQITVTAPTPTQEKFDLYSRYCSNWHGRDEPKDVGAFLNFLYDSPVTVAEWEYRLMGKLVAVGLCDVIDDSALSSVYFYFEPELSARSLGTFGALHEIECARRLGIAHYYLGFWIRDCAAMEYKANFRPAELLGLDGIWRPMEPAAAGGV